jgi:hypothetical protein
MRQMMTSVFSPIFEMVAKAEEAERLEETKKAPALPHIKRARCPRGF